MLCRRAEYVWVGGNNELRSKTRIFSEDRSCINTLENLPLWNYDGSSTNQATGKDSEVIIKPRRIYINPFNKLAISSSMDVLVLCDTWLPNGNPHPTNTRVVAENIFSQKR